MIQLTRTTDVITRGISAGQHIGAQLYTSINGQPVANLAIGEAKPGVAMTTDTLMLWLSACKPVAAVAIAILVERGYLSFDDAVAAHIHEFAANGKETITIRHVLHHTAGIRWVQQDWPHTTWAEMITRLCAMKIEPGWTPGEKAGYHVFTSWYLLGEIIQRQTGKTYNDFVRDEIFLPLGMHDCFFQMTPQQFDTYQPRLGELQRTDDARLKYAHFDSREAALNCRPASSCRGPIAQLGRFYEMLLRGGDAILSPTMVNTLTERSRAGMFDHTFRANIDWALGFIVNSGDNVPYHFGPYASRETFGHGGSQSSVGMCDPARKLVIAAVFNGAPGEAKHQQRLHDFLKALYEDLGVA